MPPKCLFPHCGNKHNLIQILKPRKNSCNQRGERISFVEQNVIINKQHDAIIDILKEFVPSFVYDFNKKHQNYICVEHYHPSVLFLKDSKKKPILGALPTLNLQENWKELSNSERCIIQPKYRIALDKTKIGKEILNPSNDDYVILVNDLINGNATSREDDDETNGNSDENIVST